MHELDPPVDKACEIIIKKHGAGEEARIRRGVRQVAALWRPSDGTPEAFIQFCENEYVPAGPVLLSTFERLEQTFESLDGSFNIIRRDLRRGVDLEIGPLLPIDERLGSFEASAHVTGDLFESKIAFVTLLNFPNTTLDERLKNGMAWSRRDWAVARIARRFETRVPAEVVQQAAAASSAAELYITQYNIYMNRLVDDAGVRLFPPGLRLITHWGLRDELKARYGDPDGLARQRMIQKVMERIVTQTIPLAVIDSDKVDWNPFTNKISGGVEGREPDTRYARWMDMFRTAKLADAYDPEKFTFIDRKFRREREIPKEDVRRMLLSVIEAPVGTDIAKLIQKRLGRPLEPFDIWYAGFKPMTRYSESDLDEMTRRRYPTPAAYSADIPRMLGVLGFAQEKAAFLHQNIIVDPSRGAGHALGAQRRDDKAHLRTRISGLGMDYKGYNIAVHEMGHNVEQSFSMTDIDFTSCSGVPNTAFTEALAFVFQARDLELLGLDKPDAAAKNLDVLEQFWATREIAGVALVDMEAWEWLYAHHDATPAEFREAVVRIAGNIWNQYYAPMLGGGGTPILAIYSHMVNSGLYTPDYPLGHLIAFQIDAHFAGAPALGPEFERVSRLGSITPDAWMRYATGSPLSAQPLIDAAVRVVADAR